MRDAYKEAGVDVEAGYETVARMKKHVEKTKRPGVLGAVGGFGGMFDLSSLDYKQPVLVSGTDGVGTKLLLAFAADRHDTIGEDAVAMCVNDIIVQGAEPLYFLDYIASGKADPARMEAVVKGISDGCQQAGCALIGGETAEMPGMYDDNEYDVAGFAVGAVEKEDIITGEHVQAEDKLIALPSSGVHSNGFSLVRKIIEERQLVLQETYAPLEKPLVEELLTPTTIYVPAVRELLAATDVTGMAHITGGGLLENVPRMLPDGLGAHIDPALWETSAIFSFLQQQGDLSDADMYGTFNMGAGFVIAVRPEREQEALDVLSSARSIGTVDQSGKLSIKGVPV
ncbi:phosphoribosylformylglycinamidine cyclo-ligase [Natribacillus halophilus]|uniref:Phosphoribosylformylglycinamidine cyclo-ligase n=1 Tax=Natribacillus halophilus TaxID=549003 RepID=A0A1G8P9I0_9BACI|nr:phosphoribosylformylglycinamidine cyclo-ligase [Natribacillus halophilus]SDI89159.1 phosphoribosylformylglycinamidine cyclo-ligase [Natribacillus halophilus]